NTMTVSPVGSAPSSPADRDREMKSKFGSRSPSARPNKKIVKQKHKASKASKREKSSEDSVDFVPSCY
ncbi:hypothetical protein PENTCL1PPCAC_26564, partial [Pristionchus entomophagus]